MRLYILPLPLSAEGRYWLYSAWGAVVRRVQHFFVERAASVRGLLLREGLSPTAALYEYDERLGDWPWEAYQTVFGQRAEAALLSEAGLAGVADPGHQVVARAHAEGYTISPLAGPSSITLALAASGLPNMHFCFHGYLPIEKKARQKALSEIFRTAKERTQIFMETPGRQQALLETILKSAPKDLLFCIAHNLTAPTELIRMAPVGLWEPLVLPKAPTLFLLGPQARGRPTPKSV